MPPLDFVLPALGVLALVGTTAAAVFNVLYDYKDASGRVNRAGRMVVAMTLVAGVIGCAATGLDGLRKHQESVETTAKALKVIGELQRNMNPLQAAKVCYDLEVSRPELLGQIHRQYPRGKEPCPQGMAFSGPDISGLKLHSKEFRTLSKTAGITLYFFKPARDDRSFVVCLDSCSDAELLVQSARTAGMSDFDYDQCTDKLSFSGSGTGDWSTNGKILSIPDLVNAQIIAIPKGDTQECNEEPFESSPCPLNPTPGLKTVRLFIGSRHALELPSGLWRRDESQGLTFYSHVLTKEELQPCCSLDLP